jgi:hypothetical protein
MEDVTLPGELQTCSSKGDDYRINYKKGTLIRQIPLSPQKQIAPAG